MGDEPTMRWYDAAGKRVPEGSPEATVQYLDDDPARPDVGRDEPKADDVKAVDAPGGDKARGTAANK